MTGGRTIHEVGTLFACAVLAVAVCVAFAWNGLSVSAAIAMSSALPVRQVLTEGIKLKLAVLGGNTIVALLLVTAQWRGSTVVLVPFTIAMLYFAYRGYMRALEEGDIWRQLDRTAKEYDRHLASTPDTLPLIPTLTFTTKRLIDLFLYTQYAHQPNEERQRQFQRCVDLTAQTHNLPQILFYLG